MNCISGWGIGKRQRAHSAIDERRRLLPGLAIGYLAGMVATCSATASESVVNRQATADHYNVKFVVTPIPDRGVVDVTMIVDQPRHLLREFRMRAPTHLGRSLLRAGPA